MTTVVDRQEELLALRPGVYSIRTEDDNLYLSDGWAVEPLGRLDAVGHALLRRLANSKQVAEGGRGSALLAQLRAGGWLTVTVTGHGRPLYTLIPRRRPPAQHQAPPSDPVLSRFALLRRIADSFVLESPASWCTVEIHDPHLVGSVFQASDGTMACPILDRLRTDLWWAGLLESPRSADAHLRRRQWSAHELWFHDRSRWPGPDGGFGATWSFRGVLQPPPAVREPFPGPVVRLDRPDLTALRAADPPLTEVIEDRRTFREHNDSAPITAGQLAEFLFRCCRNRRMWVHDGVEQLCRPYPTGGALHELEVYLAVRRVAGLEPGVYHYQPDQHQLTLVTGPGIALDRLLRAAVRSAALPRPPQLVLVVAARFGRLMWKYEAIGYRLMLTHLGVLYQLMYCVATAMGLAPCALGSGDPEAFRLATGVDPLVEDSIGEFLLGSRPTSLDTQP